MICAVELIFLLDAKYDAKPMLICSFSNSLSPWQFISNQRPFGSFRAYRRSFKCNLVFGGFWYLYCTPPGCICPWASEAITVVFVILFSFAFVETKYLAIGVLLLFVFCMHRATGNPGGICMGSQTNHRNTYENETMAMHGIQVCTKTSVSKTCEFPQAGA